MKVRTVLMALLAMVASAATYAGEAKIKWQDLNDYADARPGNDVKKPFHERLMKKFDKHFNFEAQNLPEGSVFSAEITDLDQVLDLNGRVQPAMHVPCDLTHQFHVAGDQLLDIRFLFEILVAHDQVPARAASSSAKNRMPA